MEIYKNPRNTDNNAMITYAALLCYEVFSSPLHSQQFTISTQFTLLLSALITHGYVYSASPDSDKHGLSGTPSLSLWEKCHKEVSRDFTVEIEI